MSADISWNQSHKADLEQLCTQKNKDRKLHLFEHHSQDSKEIFEYAIDEFISTAYGKKAVWEILILPG